MVTSCTYGRLVNLFNSETEHMICFQKCNRLIFLSFCVSEDILESIFSKDTNENADKIEQGINHKHCFLHVAFCVGGQEVIIKIFLSRAVYLISE